MKQLLTTLFIFLIFCTLTYGQDNNPTKFGHITKANIALKQYPSYENASAVVLDDVGQSKFLIDDDDWSITIGFYRRTRIKILTDAGASYAKVTIPFQVGYGIHEWVSDIDADTYNYENGTLVKTPINPKHIYYEKVDKNMHVVRFVLPNVKKGSIIEYRYKLETNALYRLPNWHFQWRIPVLYSKYEVRMIPFFQYVWLLQGRNSFDSHTSYIDRAYQRSLGSTNFYDYVHDYVMRNVPAYKDEQYVPSVDDYIMKINFQLAKEIFPDGAKINVITTWNSLVNDRLKDDDFGKYLKKSTKLSEKLLNMKKLSGESEQARFNAVIDYMKSHFNWNGNENWFATKKADQFLSDKVGSSQEINLFTVGMLRAAGIEAYPLIISTRDHGTIKYNYPYIHFFNDVIILAKINGKLVLSDASAKNCLNNRIPIRCINDEGLIIKKGKGKVSWIPLNKTPLSTTITENNISIQNHELTNSVLLMATEYDALSFRNHYSKDPNKLRKKLDSKGYNLMDSTISVKNIDKRDRQFKLSYSFSMQASKFGDLSNKTASKIYVDPFFNEIGKKNMFTQSERTYPVDLIYPDKQEFTSTLTIPEGYKIDYLPKSLQINNDLYQLSYTVMKNGNRLTVTLEYSFKKSTYPASDYFKLKQFFGQVIKKGSENIVLARKKVAMK